MPDSTHRKMKPKYSPYGELVSFADSAALLITGQSALDDLNQRISQPVLMNRFRPNLVYTGGTPFGEDNWKICQIGHQKIRVTHRCIRCNVPNINQETGKIVKEPNRTLATFRRFDNQIYFGVNGVWLKDQSDLSGIVQVGDSVIPG